MIINTVNNSYKNNTNFNGNLKFIKITEFCLEKVGKDITPEKIKTTPWIIKKIIKSFTPNRIKELAKINGYLAKISKLFFDNKFGENNYTVIALGRSVASITENMKLLGADVRIIPLSGLRNGLPKNIENIEIYKDYLKSIGIDEETLDENPDRKFILFDYAYTGNTLDAAKELFNKHIFKEKKKNLLAVSINKILAKENSYETLRNLFVYNRFKQFSPVGKLDIKDLDQCIKQSKPQTINEYISFFAKIIRNLFLFNIEDNIENIHFSYPQKEIEIIHKRHHTQEAMKRAIENVIKKNLFLLEQHKKTSLSSTSTS